MDEDEDEETAINTVGSAAFNSTPALGYSVRTASWRFTIWLPWDEDKSVADWSEGAVAVAPRELYDQTHDGGKRETDFDVLASSNQAYNTSMHDVVQKHLAMVTSQFHTLAPKPHPTPWGILGPPDKHVCCASECGTCRGKGCADRPGGKTECWASEITKKGDSCVSHKAPCVV